MEATPGKPPRPEGRQPKDDGTRVRRVAARGSQGNSFGSGQRSRKDSLNDRLEDVHNSFAEDIGPGGAELGDQAVEAQMGGTGRVGLAGRRTAQMDSEFDRDSRAGTQDFKQPARMESLNQRDIGLTPGAEPLLPEPAP